MTKPFEVFMELSPIIWAQALVAKRHSALIGWLTGAVGSPGREGEYCAPLLSRSGVVT